jgi:hypothetical protein
MIWQLAVFPLLPLRIPGTPVVILVPIVSDRELHDRDAEARGVHVERHVTAVIVVSDIRCVEPSAIISKRHITPAPIIEAAHHLDRLIGIELRNHWIAVVRTRINIDRLGRNRVLRGSSSRQGEQIRAKRETQATSGSHSVPPKL